MRFISDSADIPDELIKDVSDGHVVFLCGAGVSKRVGMPSFKQLVEQIYSRIGETPNNEAAERVAFENREYDRALRSLEKRIHLPRRPSRVRFAAAELLTPLPDLSTPDHLNLLRLSRDSDGRVKLLTTNFDPLFECWRCRPPEIVRRHGDVEQ